MPDLNAESHAYFPEQYGTAYQSRAGHRLKASMDAAISNAERCMLTRSYITEPIKRIQLLPFFRHRAQSVHHAALVYLPVFPAL